MEITIKIPDAIKNRVLKGFCSQSGYAETLDSGEPNPETKKQFMHRKIRAFIMDAVLKDETEIAHNLAADTVKQSVTSDIVIEVTDEIKKADA